MLFAFTRDVMSLVLAVLLSLNAAFTALVIFVSHADSYGQLRYNMRAMPIAVIGVGWICLRLKGRARVAAWAAAVAVLALSLPVTWHTMRVYPNQYEETAFVKVLTTGQRRIDLVPYRRMAAYITSRAPGRDAILTDAAVTFPVMLLSSHPDWFLDRIDKGDTYWLSVLHSPYGKVRYMLLMGSGSDGISARTRSSARAASRGSR